MRKLQRYFSGDDNRNTLFYLALPTLGIAAFLLWLILPLSKNYGFEYAWLDAEPVVAAPITTISTLGTSEVIITTENVANVISTLSRPAYYDRVYTITQHWKDGFGTVAVTLSARDDVLTIDRSVMLNRKELTLAEIDATSLLPTYEDVLLLDPAQIEAASFIEYNGEPCIFVRFSGLIYTHEYYISVNSGLLKYARKLDGERVVYEASEVY
jgi:hypothetical protein